MVNLLKARVHAGRPLNPGGWRPESPKLSMCIVWLKPQDWEDHLSPTGARCGLNLGLYLKSPDFYMLAINSECFQHIMVKTHMQVTFGPQLRGVRSDSDLGAKKRGQESAFLKYLCRHLTWRWCFPFSIPLYSPKHPECWVQLVPLIEENRTLMGKKSSQGNRMESQCYGSF